MFYFPILYVFFRYYKTEYISVLNNHDDPILSKFDVIIPIFHKEKTLSYLLLGDFDGEKIEVSPIIRHLPFIQTITNLIVVAQENKRLFAESIANASMQTELELASRMQNMLIPETIPARKDLDVYSVYQPHQIVGGDYYDFFKISEDETGFCIADVSGKGISLCASKNILKHPPKNKLESMNLVFQVFHGIENSRTGFIQFSKVKFFFAWKALKRLFRL